MVLWEKTGWQWAGSNQVFLPSHPPFSELTPVNELINLVAALTHSKSLSMCLGLAHAQSPASVPWGGLGHRGGRGSLGWQGVPGDPGAVGAGPEQPPPSPADWWVLPLPSSA